MLLLTQTSRSGLDPLSVEVASREQATAVLSLLNLACTAAHVAAKALTRHRGSYFAAADEMAIEHELPATYREMLKRFGDSEFKITEGNNVFPIHPDVLEIDDGDADDTETD